MRYIPVPDPKKCPYYTINYRYHVCKHDDNWNKKCVVYGGKCPLPEMGDVEIKGGDEAIIRAIRSVDRYTLTALRMGAYIGITDPVSRVIFSKQEVDDYLNKIGYGYEDGLVGDDEE